MPVSTREVRVLLLLAVACAPRVEPAAITEPAGTTWSGQLPSGELVTLAIADGTITALEDAGEAGTWLVPAFIDSHVHLAYLPEAAAMADGGIVAAVDLAAPLSAMDPTGPPRGLSSGPMITAVGGYPTASWGADGYGLEVSGEDEAAAAVDDLVARGAGAIKVALTDAPTLSDSELQAAVDRAHVHGLKVLAHALDDANAARAAAAGVDALAHTPVAALSDDTVAAWSGRAVVSTLGAFGGSPTAVDNLRRLRESGVVVLYGTDFGNTRTPGIDPAELTLLLEAGLSGAEVIAAGTDVPASWWNLPDLGVIEVGRAASFLVLDEDPAARPIALADPAAVVLDGLPR